MWKVEVGRVKQVREGEFSMIRLEVIVQFFIHRMEGGMQIILNYPQDIKNFIQYSQKNCAPKTYYIGFLLFIQIRISSLCNKRYSQNQL